VVVESEANLVEAAQEGHLGSFAGLYERYYSSMVALAYSELADAQLSEDAAQEAFAIACRDLAKLRSKDKFAAWLAGICRNVARQMSRSKAKAVAQYEEARTGNEKDDYRDLVLRAVWKLRASEREPIVLRYYDNMAYEQIACVLGISAQAVHGRLTRAKRKIAAYLRGNGFRGSGYERG